MSFALTAEQMLAKTKYVTRRLGWDTLTPGTLIQAVEKSQGLGKGGKVRKLGVIRVLTVRREPLRHMVASSYGDAEAKREGFPKMSGEQFARMFCEHMGVGLDHFVTRIEFEHVDGLGDEPSIAAKSAQRLLGRRHRNHERAARKAREQTRG